jgi:hypothetical protein
MAAKARLEGGAISANAFQPSPNQRSAKVAPYREKSSCENKDFVDAPTAFEQSVRWIALCPKQTLLTVRCASAMEGKFAVGQGSSRENHS